MGNSKQNTDKKGLNLNKIAVWVALASIFSVILVGGRYFSNMAVQINNIGVIDQRQNKWIQRQVEMHEDFDAYKIETKDADHALELKIKDETIARQKVEIEFYKNK